MDNVDSVDHLRSPYPVLYTLPIKMRTLAVVAFVLLFYGVPATQAQSTFDTIQHQILNQNCVSCHSPGTSFATQSGLVLTEEQSYDQLVDVLPRNSAAVADGLLRVSSTGGAPGIFRSFLWEKINAPEQQHFYDDHPGYGSLMPLGRPPLTNGELAFVQEWLLAGAPRTGTVADMALLDDTSRYEPPEFRPLDPPTNGMQFHLGPFDVWPSEINDREFLYFEPQVTTEDEFVNRYEISYREGSHHFILYNYEAGIPTPQPQVYRDIRDADGNMNIIPALQLNNLFPFQFFIGTQTPYTNYSMPEGVALRLPAGSGFDLNSHSVNRSGETTTGEVYVNLHTVDRTEVRHVADYDNFGNFDISLPPGEVTTISKTFTFSEARQVIQMWSHSHEHTVEFRIEGVSGKYAGELLYWTNDWEHPPLLTLDDPLLFSPGDRIRLVTTYNNWTDAEINFGPLSSDEMQFVFYVYTTDMFPTGDANGDYVVDAADLAIWNANKFTAGTVWSQADFNYDGVTDVRDFNLWNDNRTNAEATHAVPEPCGSLSFFVVVCLSFGARRWKSPAEMT